MKNILIIIACLLTINTNAQLTKNQKINNLREYTIIEYVNDDYLHDHWQKMTASFIAGAASGFNEVLLHHYSKFKLRHKNVNDQFWNPSISHVNKWKNGGHTQGEKFFQSSDLLVWTTDAYHTVRLIERIGIISAIIIPINSKQRKAKKFKHYATDGLVYWASYGLGFYTTYAIIYK